MKRYLIKIAGTLFMVIVCLLSGALFNEGRFLPASANANNVPVIIIDPGHGGFDGGAVALDGTVEKNINLKISLSLASLLKASGYQVIMTRDTDTSTESNTDDTIGHRKKSDLKNRLDLMGKYPDSIFVSVHLNKFTTSAARGSQVFFSGNNDDSMALGEMIQKSVREKLQNENNRVIKKATSSTYLLHNATIPAVLVECGFLSNQKELALLKDDEYQNKIAFCIFCGINNYFKK